MKLTSNQFNVLYDLQSGHRLSAQDLNDSNGMNVSASTAPSLVRRGLATRLKNGDYKITAAGRRAFTAAADERRLAAI